MIMVKNFLHLITAWLLGTSTQRFRNSFNTGVTSLLMDEREEEWSRSFKLEADNSLSLWTNDDGNISLQSKESIVFFSMKINCRLLYFQWNILLYKIAGQHQYRHSSYFVTTLSNYPFPNTCWTYWKNKVYFNYKQDGHQYTYRITGNFCVAKCLSFKFLRDFIFAEQSMRNTKCTCYENYTWLNFRVFWPSQKYSHSKHFRLYGIT